MLNLKKKGNVGLITLSLILAVYFLLFLGVYDFTSVQRDNFISSNLKIELANSLYTLRSNLIDLTKQNNSNLIYENKYDLINIQITLKNNSISGILIKDNSYNNLNISSLGINFCSNYNLSPIQRINFYFNGSCISII